MFSALVGQESAPIIISLIKNAQMIFVMEVWSVELQTMDKYVYRIPNPSEQVCANIIWLLSHYSLP